jgi:hypothetical protein
MDEIDNLISELQPLRRKLQTNGERILLTVSEVQVEGASFDGLPA